MDQSPVTPVTPESPPSPQRMSALYQYHNAPEVAPAHGLEFDDTVYPTSDKYPVLRQQYDNAYDAKDPFQINTRPPRIIFGMKVRTFLMVAVVMALVIIGAAVGGAVGGKTLRNGSANDGVSMSTNSTANSTASRTTATFSAPTPTYTPLSDCPASDDTTYTSSYATADSTTAGFAFTKHCDLASPLNATSARIAEAFVYSFSDCIELCAGYNAVHGSSDCSVAVYAPTVTRPMNCWVGYAANVTAGNLGTETGTDVALLLSSSSPLSAAS